MGDYHPQIATPALGELAERQYGVVSREQLRALGFSDTAIRDRIRSGRLRMHRGVYALVGFRALRAEARMLAAVLACGPGAALSHGSAAALWELRPTGRQRIDVTAGGRGGAADAAIELHRVRKLVPADVTMHRGIPVTTVPRTLVDIAGVVGASALERALAQAEILGLYDQTAMREILARSNGRRGATKLRAALHVPPACTRSELERRFLRLCDEHGLPRPLVNVDVCGHEVDFCWPDARLVVETDGHAYHHTRHAFELDRRRDADLLVAGYRVLRITYHRLLTDPEGVVRTIRALLAEGVARYG
jgi:predicted transcriptional regulator of viral defense system